MLKANLIESSENELKIEIKGVNRSLLHLLQKTLLQNEKVEIAGYDVPHPLLGSAILYIKTKGHEKPTQAVMDASEKLKEGAREFEKTFKKALKEYSKG